MFRVDGELFSQQHKSAVTLHHHAGGWSIIAGDGRYIRIPGIPSLPVPCDERGRIRVCRAWLKARARRRAREAVIEEA
jgi:hypothetical protein